MNTGSIIPVPDIEHRFIESSNSFILFNEILLINGYLENRRLREAQGMSDVKEF